MREELLQERKKAIYGLICDELYVPMKAKEIAAVLNVPKSDRRDLAEVLDALVAEGKVEVSSKGKYMKSEGKFLTGVFAAHPRGFGFVTVEGENEDIFIPESQVNGAVHGDTVLAPVVRGQFFLKRFVMFAHHVGPTTHNFVNHLIHLSGKVVVLRFDIVKGHSHSVVALAMIMKD